MIHGIRVFTYALLSLAVTALATPAYATPACQACHSAPTMGKARITTQSLSASVHPAFMCRDCHTTLPEQAVPHDHPAPRVNCARCHGPQPLRGARPAKPVRHGGPDAPADLLPGCAECHGSHDVRRPDAPGSLVNRANVVQTCAACHGPKGAAAKALGDRQVVEYRKSVHGQVDPNRPGLVAAVCTDCHGDHSILPSSDPASRVHKTNVPAVCGACHAKEYQEYQKSTHGKALADGKTDAPSCTDCHGEHNIQTSSAPGSRTSSASITETCAGCHADKTLIDRYNLAAGRISSYRDSYHGVANRFGEVRAASCASCHNAHLVLPSSDPGSSVHPANLPGTCGSPDCHPGAGANFARGSIHLMPSPTRDAVQYWVAKIYSLFIWALILGFVALIICDLVQYARRGWKVHGDGHANSLDSAKIRRFSTSQLRQHGVLIFSFTMLILTGFPVRYPDAPGSDWLVRAFGGVTLRGNIHRAMAILLILVCVWHVAWTVFTRRGREDFLHMLPKPRDIPRAFGMLKYYFGLAMEMPGFGRFNLIEKFEYLSMGWGSAVMIITGFALWFPELALRFIPKWGLDVCEIVHGYEAVLAFLAITIWHFYHVHLKPGSFPMSRVFLDGSVTLGEMRHEHRLEYERLAGELSSRIAAREKTAAAHEEPTAKAESPEPVKESPAPADVSEPDRESPAPPKPRKKPRKGGKSK